MYHAIVKRIAKKNFEAESPTNYDALLKGCTPNIFHRFGGSHALGGERHDWDALRLWFERLGRMNPALTLKTQDIWVKGLPHNTTVVMRWTATDTRIDGSPYLNHGVHITHMRWGKMDAMDANEDSQGGSRKPGPACRSWCRRGDSTTHCFLANLNQTANRRRAWTNR